MNGVKEMTNNSDNSREKGDVDTGGGAYIGGNMTVGGDFVGRDQTHEQLQKLRPDLTGYRF
jgi:hypothetical protein